MSDVLQYECERWKLVIWTRDSNTPRKLLTAVLAERGKELPSDKVYFSFPIGGGESCLLYGNELPLDVGISKFDVPEPLCYENRDYEFEFSFKSGFTPDKKLPVFHRLSEVEKSFRVKEKIVRGVINFRNNVGWFKLGICYDDRLSQ